MSKGMSKVKGEGVKDQRNKCGCGQGSIYDTKIDFANNMVNDERWKFSVKCCYYPFIHDACMTIVDMHVWYYKNGASKYIE